MLPDMMHRFPQNPSEHDFMEKPSRAKTCNNVLALPCLTWRFMVQSMSTCILLPVFHTHLFSSQPAR